MPLPELPPKVILEFAKLTLVMPAEPDKLLLVKPVIVLFPAAIVLFVKVPLVANPTNVSELPGSVKVVLSVPLNVIVLLIPSVFPAAMFKVLVPLLVMVNPFTVVNVGVVKVGALVSRFNTKFPLLRLPDRPLPVERVPTLPVAPVAPADPCGPVNPVSPFAPSVPVWPGEPVAPLLPGEPGGVFD